MITFKSKSVKSDMITALPSGQMSVWLCTEVQWLLHCPQDRCLSGCVQRCSDYCTALRQVSVWLCIEVQWLLHCPRYKRGLSGCVQRCSDYCTALVTSGDCLAMYRGAVTTALPSLQAVSVWLCTEVQWLLHCPRYKRGLSGCVQRCSDYCTALVTSGVCLAVYRGAVITALPSDRCLSGCV